MKSSRPPDHSSADWILYDNQCGFCSRWVRFWQPVLAKRSIQFAGLQEPWVSDRLKMSGEELLFDIRLLRRDRVFSGADVYLQVARRIWWAWPFYAIFSLPVFNQLIHFCYRWFAHNRHRISHTCGLRAEGLIASDSKAGNSPSR